MVIELNNLILKKIKREGLLVQDYIALELVYSEDSELLDEYLDSSNIENNLVIHGLYRKGYLITNDGEDSLLYKLTSKSETFLQEISILFKEE